MTVRCALGAVAGTAAQVAPMIDGSAARVGNPLS